MRNTKMPFSNCVSSYAQWLHESVLQPIRRLPSFDDTLSDSKCRSAERMHIGKCVVPAFVCAQGLIPLQ